MTTVTAQCPAPNCTFDFADFDWISNNTDTVDTYHLGVKLTLIPKVLDWPLTGNYSNALGRIEMRNPVAPGSGMATQNTAAVAKRMPAHFDPFFPSVGLGAIWLGNDLQNYSAHIVGLTLSYRFK